MGAMQEKAITIQKLFDLLKSGEDLTKKNPVFIEGWVRTNRSSKSIGFIVCLSLILAGAAGNIIDCLFYGMIFNNPPAPMIAEFVPWGTGYDGLMQGRVVDMFYFPLVEWNWPSWLPVWGGQHFIFFSPIFNFADSCISVGVIALLLFHHKRLQHA